MCGFNHVLSVGCRSAPIGTDPELLTPLEQVCSGDFTLSFEADVQAGNLYVWLNEQLLGCLFEGVHWLGDSLPTVGIGPLMTTAVWPVANLPTVEVLDSPPEIRTELCCSPGPKLFGCIRLLTDSVRCFHTPKKIDVVVVFFHHVTLYACSFSPHCAVVPLRRPTVCLCAE
jgi:hypothetical protein